VHLVGIIYQNTVGFLYKDELAHSVLRYRSLFTGKTPVVVRSS